MQEFPRLWRHCTGVFVVVVAACLSISGCSYSYLYDVTGVILEMPDGTPISDVEVTLKSPNYGITVMTSEPCLTKADGTFLFSFRTYLPHDGLAGSRDIRWTLFLTKADYADQIVDITPIRKSESKNLVSVVAYLKTLP